MHPLLRLDSAFILIVSRAETTRRSSRFFDQHQARNQLTTIRTEGSLLPADLLARISEEDGALAGRCLVRRFCLVKTPHPKPSAPSVPRLTGEVQGAFVAFRGVGNAKLPFPHFGGRGRGMGDNALPLTDLLYRHLEDDPQAENMQTIREQVAALTDRYGFFHWHVAFPDVFQAPDDLKTADPRVDTGGYNEAAGWNGGFDVVLGNPPWERIKIQEKEWFAQRDPDIAGARNAAARRKMIAALKTDDPALYIAFAADKRKAEGISHFIRASERFPLCGRGDVNTYTVFAELDRFLLNRRGRVGMVCPSGIATDDTTKFFFQDLMTTQSLASMYDFENRQGLFAGVHRSYKFCLLTMTGADVRSRESEFVFFALNIGDLEDKWRRFRLSAADIAMLNPNTGTMATFRSQRDAEITKAIYRRIPVLQDDAAELEQMSGGGADKVYWNIKFFTMFHMSNDSDKFHIREQLEEGGYRLVGNTFVLGDSVSEDVRHVE